MTFTTSRISFISHAATSALRHAAFPQDESLDEQELSRIKALRWRRPQAHQVLSAPERRAHMTSQALGLSAQIAQDLVDCNFGAWRGRKLDELEQEDPAGLMAWLTDPSSAPHGGESVVLLIERVGRWLDCQTHSGHTIAIAHPAIIRSALVYILGAPAQAFWRIDIAPLSLTDLRHNGRAWTVRCVAGRLGEI